MFLLHHVLLTWVSAIWLPAATLPFSGCSREAGPCCPFAVTCTANGSLPAGLQGAVSSVETGTATLQDGSAGGGQAKLADGQVVEYDWLVLALGSETSTFGIEGVKELAVPFCSFEDAMKVGSNPFGVLFSLLRWGQHSHSALVGSVAKGRRSIFGRHAAAGSSLP